MLGPELHLHLFARLLLASILGGLIGLEREVHGRPAGFRTHLLVSLGSCLFCLTSIEVYQLYGNFSGVVPVGIDPGRIAAQVVTGIGFLGAGAIIRERASIRGLTTAACLWVAAGLGIACGLGLFQMAIVVTAIALINLLLLKQVEKRLNRDIYVVVKVWGDDRPDFIQQVYQLLGETGIERVEAKFERDLERKLMFIEFQMKRGNKITSPDLLAKLSELQGVKRVSVD
ncbi:MgtC family protein [Citrifermentans bemidjiense Bem]|uniref:MgtC family protein n=1 Tax=Citrifermentans bemidjiense (strain ATCC BAA-1014 / DSM 16622 / JCM 12645 / Bem) TaxID=404380 RepID=B5EF17_CITBB|nr:MgtC family protein [Citrifermentans bemidjiense Bem]